MPSLPSNMSITFGPSKLGPPGHLEVKLLDTNKEEVTGKSGDTVGWLLIGPLGMWEHRGWEGETCEADIERLGDLVREKTGHPPGRMYEIMVADLMPEYRGHRYGRAMYEHALHELAAMGGGPAILIMPDYCVGGETSDLAQRVWKSLGRDYLSVGDVVSSIRGKRHASVVAVAQRKLQAAEVPRKGRYYWGVWYGDDEGDWIDPHNIDFQWKKVGWDWQMTTERAMAYGGRLVAVAGATPTNRGFLRALGEIVRKYPDLANFLIEFDGPPRQTVGEVLGMRAKAEERFDWSKIKFYHGTTSNVYAAIMQDGLRPRGETNVEPTYGAGLGARPGRTDAVYLSNQPSIAQSAALDAAKKYGGDPILLAVTGLDPSRVMADEDSRETDPRKSLDRMGTIAYAGTIPPRLITLAGTKDSGTWQVWASRVAARWLQGDR